jgi:hypothetical protein
MIEGWAYNPPPYWPQPPGNWTPPPGWQPDPAWGPVPPGWQLWVPARGSRRRRAPIPVAGLAAVLLFAVLAIIIPRSAGPAADDPRAGGAAPIAQLRPALSNPGASSESTPAASPTASAAAASESPQAVADGPTSTPTPTVIRQFRTCSELNQVYPNGVGMPEATDRTTAADPVTNFGRSSTLYRLNLDHDRDGDGIACEPV